MTVEEAIEQLMDMPMTATLAICGHEFDNEDVGGWHVSHFAPTEDGEYVMIEGAGRE